MEDKKQETKITVIEFNYHLNRAKNSTKSLDAIYVYCLNIMRKYIYFRFGNKSFLECVPHDVFTKVILEKPPDKYIDYPSAYLCEAAHNYILSLYREKDNNTEELTEYSACADADIEFFEFSDPKAAVAWNKLDEQSKYIIRMNIFKHYQLNEIADIMGLSYDCVRTKKSRALKYLKHILKQCKQLNKEV